MTVPLSIALLHAACLQAQKPVLHGGGVWTGDTGLDREVPSVPPDEIRAGTIVGGRVVYERPR